MFELFEVEIIWCGIEFYVVGCIFIVVIVCEFCLCWLVDVRVVELCDKCIFGLWWCVKYLLMDFDDLNLGIYLGMFGILWVVIVDMLLCKYDYIDLYLDSGWLLCFNDLCCFGVLLYLMDVLIYLLLVNLGLEFLD